MSERTLRTAVLVALAAGSSGLGAQEALNPTWHGYVSQGFVDTSDNDLYYGDTSEGTFEYNEAALNVSVEPLRRLRFGAQIMAREKGFEGNHHVALDWATGDYRAQDWLGVRFGRVKVPFGLYGVLRDTDVSRPEVKLPEGVYPETLADVGRAYDGGGLYGTLPIGGGAVDYEAFIGSVDLDESFVTYQLVRTTVAGLAGGLGASGLTGAQGVPGEANTEMRAFYGGALEVRPARGLRLKLTGLKTKLDVTADSHIDASLQGLPVSLPVRTETRIEYDYYVIGSVELARGPWRVTAEYTWQKLRNTLRAELPTGLILAPTIVTKPAGWYAQAVYRAGERWQLGAYYTESWSDSDDKDGARFSAVGADPAQAWDKDFTVHVRFDPLPNLLVKAEYHAIDGTFRVDPLDNPQGLSPNWHTFVIKATCHF